MKATNVSATARWLLYVHLAILQVRCTGPGTMGQTPLFQWHSAVIQRYSALKMLKFSAVVSFSVTVQNSVVFNSEIQSALALAV
jgi:hypothetical protein